MSPRLLSLALLLPLLASCGDSPEKIQADMLSEMKGNVEIVKSVTDEASAKAAAEKLKASNERMKAITERIAKLKVDPKNIPDLDKKNAEEADKVSGDMEAALEALQKKNPAAAKIVDEALAGTIGKF